MSGKHVKEIELTPAQAICMMLEAEIRACLARGDKAACIALLRGIQGVWTRLKPEFQRLMKIAAARN